MPEPYPRLRDDLIFQVMTRGDQTLHVAFDPIKNEYHELDELQFAIVSEFDGRSSLEALVTLIEEKHDAEVSRDTLQEFVSQIEALNLLDPTCDGRLHPNRSRTLGPKIRAHLKRRGVVVVKPGRDEPELARALDRLEADDIPAMAGELRALLDRSPKEPRARYLMNVLLHEHLGKSKAFESVWWWRLPVADPHRFLKRLDRRVGGLIFRREMLAVCLIAFMVAVVLLANDWDRLAYDFDHPARLYTAAFDPIFLVLFYVVGTSFYLFHETCHGLACTHFGGRVREMGILIAYLRPTAYCDISSTYFIENRWHRVMVAAVGSLSDILVWALFVLIYSVADTEFYLGRLAEIYVPLLTLSIVLDAWNPFTKSDAYFVLTDILEYPNLRSDAFEYLRLRLLSALTGVDHPVTERQAAHRGLLLAYSIPALILTTLAIAVFLFGGVDYLATHFGVLGLLVATALGALLFGGPMTAMARWSWRERAWLWSHRRFRRISVLLAASAVLVLSVPWPVEVLAPCRVVPRVARVHSEQATRIARVLVEEGDAVEAGQPLLEFDTSALSFDAVQKSAAVDGFAEDLRAMVRGARTEELEVRRAEVGAAERARLAADARVERYRELASRGLRDREYDEAVQEAHQAATEASIGRAELALLAAGAEPEVIGAARFREEAEQVRLRWFNQRLEHAVLRSPIAGVVMARYGDRGDEMRNASVKQGTELFQIRPDGQLILRAEVPMTQPIEIIRVGQSARVALFGLSGRSLAAEVTRLASMMSASDAAGSTLDLELTVGEPDRFLPAGLTGRVRIRGETHALIWHAYSFLRRVIELDLMRMAG